MRKTAAAFAVLPALLLISPAHATMPLTLSGGGIRIDVDASACERTSESSAKCRTFLVSIVTSSTEDAGSAPDRAQQAAAESCSTSELPAEPSITTFNGRRFAQISVSSVSSSKNSTEICFAALGDSSLTTVVVFRELGNSGEYLLHADARRVMQTVADKVEPKAIPTALMDEPGARDTTRILVILAIAIGVLFSILIARHFVLRHRALREHQLTRKDQIAGLKCVVCKRKIVAENDALPCSDCKQPVHKDCLTKHAIAAHGPDAPLYR
jgi:hypothetical protein